MLSRLCLVLLYIPFFALSIIISEVGIGVYGNSHFLTQPRLPPLGRALCYVKNEDYNDILRWIRYHLDFQYYYIHAPPESMVQSLIGRPARPSKLTDLGILRTPRKPGIAALR